MSLQDLGRSWLLQHQKAVLGALARPSFSKSRWVIMSGIYKTAQSVVWGCGCAGFGAAQQCFAEHVGGGLPCRTAEGTCPWLAATAAQSQKDTGPHGSSCTGRPCKARPGLCNRHQHSPRQPEHPEAARGSCPLGTRRPGALSSPLDQQGGWTGMAMCLAIHCRTNAY